MSRTWLTIVLLLWGVGAALAAGPRLVAVDYRGFDNLDMDEITSVVENKPTPVIGLVTPRTLDMTSAERDRRRLLMLYRDKGFFNASISVRTEPAPGGVRLVFVAHEGSPVRIRSVKIVFDPPQARERWGGLVEGAVGLRAGERLRLGAYREAKRAIVELLEDMGHPLARVKGQVRVYPRLGVADILLVVRPGQEMVFGPVLIKGNRRTKTLFIRRRLAFGPSERFSARALALTQQRLLATGLFRAVGVRRLYSRAHGGVLPVELSVDERPAHEIRGAIGWGSEERARLGLRYTWRQPVGWGEIFSMRGKISSIYEGVVARVRMPHPTDLSSSFEASGGVEMVEDEAYISRKRFFELEMRRRLARRWRAAGGVMVEGVNVLELRSAVEDPAYEQQLFFISSLVGELSRDTRNDLLNPTRGALARFRVELALGIWGSEIDFIRPVAELRRILPVRPERGQVIALKAKAGVCWGLWHTGRIPLVRRFFPGGADSVRGYPYQGLGPLDGGGRPLGGEAMAEASCELRFRLWGKLGGVVFVDCGNAWRRLEDVGMVRFTAGGGLRYMTAVGPLRLDVGYQLNPPDAPIPRYQVYLSVGQAF